MKKNSYIWIQSENQIENTASEDVQADVNVEVIENENGCVFAET